MDPVTLIVTALATGAAAAAKDIGGDAVKSAFNGLKTLIAKKFGSKANIESAVASVEQKPDSDNRKGVLKEELETAGADKDEELLAQVQAFLKLLEEKGVSTGVNLSASNVTASASQGGTAVGAFQVGGNVSGDVQIGGSRINKTGGVDISPTSGTVNITGDVVGGHKTTNSG